MAEVELPEFQCLLQIGKAQPRVVVVRRDVTGHAVAEQRLDHRLVASPAKKVRVHGRPEAMEILAGLVDPDRPAVLRPPQAVRVAVRTEPAAALQLGEQQGRALGSAFLRMLQQADTD